MIDAGDDDPFAERRYRDAVLNLAEGEQEIARLRACIEEVEAGNARLHDIVEEQKNYNAELRARVRAYEVSSRVGLYGMTMPDGEPMIYPSPEAKQLARLRKAVGALIATGSLSDPWWAVWTDGQWIECMFCESVADTSAEFVTHAPDCPAIAVEEMMEEIDNG